MSDVPVQPDQPDQPDPPDQPGEPDLPPPASRTAPAARATAARPSWWHTPLQRPEKGGEVGGVVRALANAYRFEVKPWRIVLVVGCIMFPPLFAAYLIAWIAIPAAPAPPKSPAELSRAGSGAWAALIGLALAAWLLADGGPGEGGLVVAAILVGAGVLLWRAATADGPGAASAGGRSRAGTVPADAVPADGMSPDWPAPASGAPAPAWSGPPHWGPFPPSSPGADAAARDGNSLVPLPRAELSADLTLGPLPGGPGPAPWSSPPPWDDDAPPVTRRHRPPVTGLTLAFVPVLLGVAFAGDAIGWWSMSVAGALGLTLATVGVGLVIGAVVGAGRAQVLVALALLPATVLTTTLPDVSLRGAWGDRDVTPGSVAEASAGFDHGIGQLTIDLGELPSDAMATVPVELGVGQLVVLVPEDLDLVVAATIGAGQLDVGQRRVDGVSIDETWSESAPVEAERETADDVGALRLELEVGFGHIEVERVPRTGTMPR